MQIGNFLSLVGLLFFLAATAIAGEPGKPGSADAFPTPTTKKGLQVQMVDDALALGVRHAALNVDLTRLIDPSAEEGSFRWEYAGKSYALRRDAVERLDALVRPLSDQGVVVYLILLTYASGDAERDRLMLHPAYARGEKQTGPIAMFNVASEEGRGWLGAACGFLADRYSKDGGQHGRVWGYIAGNEVNSHWFWANMGRASLAEVVDAYERGVRIIHSAVRQSSAQARVYISLEHCWAERYAGGDETQAVPGREFLTAFAALVRERGDFDWHLAHHPYPEPLTDCRFWLDRENAPQSPDAKVVTFRNLEVLVDFLARDEMQWQGAPRRVILSEQGFHAARGREGELNQAAAYALAYQKVDRLPQIDAFILHRHVDHAHEGGLRLGLWTNRRGTVATPDRKRPIYDVFRAAGTADQEAAFAFALPLLDAATWDEALANLRNDAPRSEGDDSTERN
ncbi:MAG: DUF5722 domain-containing protein [Pirellulaceae bacterium]|nr:DUF5722 domain-containing protein [Pirellulaceae bacterium]